MKVTLITEEDLEIFKEDLLKQIEQIITASARPKEKSDWLRSAEVRELLNISQGTLQNLRINGTIAYSIVGKTIYYKRGNIMDLLENGSPK
ncbi:helix-turn-helix domain-containing protein [Pedobacter fastidiosus]|uniref:Helix-turn-helix domain-containing protein n=2 Tax=Pedobacter fastidiosus TaxID=2765361 RepID=A0ABR7KYE4_9SPHI|nr:helix-turn-helix domain-containing protein [Pedobacter fastidiosus]